MVASLLLLFLIFLLNPAAGLILFFVGILGISAFGFIANPMSTQF